MLPHADIAGSALIAFGAKRALRFKGTVFSFLGFSRALIQLERFANSRPVLRRGRVTENIK